MAKLIYHGKNGDPALDAEKIESLRIQNALAKAKLARIEGSIVDKRKVVFMLEYSLTLLRTQILTIPQLVSAELRGLDNAQAHAVRMRVEKSIYSFLEQLSLNMERAHRSDEFIAELEQELSGNGHGDDSAQLKRDRVNAKRRSKYQRKKR
jgi:hypothetical protein